MFESIIKRTFNRRKPHTNPCRGSIVIDINLPDSENFFDVVMKEESHWGISRLILTIATIGHLFKRTFILYKKYRRLRLCKNYGPTATNQFAFFRFGSFDHRPKPGCHYNLGKIKKKQKNEYGTHNLFIVVKKQNKEHFSSGFMEIYLIDSFETKK